MTLESDSLLDFFGIRRYNADSSTRTAWLDYSNDTVKGNFKKMQLKWLLNRDRRYILMTQHNCDVNQKNYFRY
jgi:hypothetical protein